MSRFIVNGRKLKYEHVWFEDEIKEFDKTIDVLEIHGCKNSIEKISEKKTEIERQESLITDLQLEQELLISKFSKTVKNEINRSVKENVKIRIFTSDEILENEKLLEDFSVMYKEMYEEKGMKNQILYIPLLNSYASKDSLIISVAYIDDIPVVYHSYIVNGEKARLLHSCSEFRCADNQHRNAIGRANKYLHYVDILKFKTDRYKQYDWGGVSSLTEPNGIDKFKMAFGGEGISYYNISCKLSLKSTIVDKIKNLKG